MSGLFCENNMNNYSFFRYENCEFAREWLDYYFLLISITRPFLAMKIMKSLVNDKITASCHTNLSPTHYFKCYK